MSNQRHFVVFFALALSLSGAAAFGLLLTGCSTPTQTPAPTVSPMPAAISPTPPAISPSPAATPSLPSGFPTPGPGQKLHITDHFVIYYTADVSSTQVFSVAHYLEAAWHDIPPFLGIEPPSRPTRVYMGLRTPTSRGTTVIVITAGALDAGYYVVPHEFTHLLTGHSGLRWLEEGLAEYMQELFPAGPYSGEDNISVDSWTIGLIASDRWVTLWKFPLGVPTHMSPATGFEVLRAYEESGSFVKYLIDTYGVSTFWKMHNDTGGWPAAKKVYGKSIDALVEEWHQRLAKATIPTKDCPACIASYFEWTDVEIQFEQHMAELSSSIQDQVEQEFAAVYPAFNLKDAPAMQQHLKAARQLLSANGIK